MADLISHASVAVLAKAGTRWSMAPVFVAGTLAPDLLSRAPAIALGWVHRNLVTLPDVMTYGWDPLHQPLGMLIAAYGLTLLFQAEERRSVFLNIVGGMSLHLALDLLQHHFGVGYLLAFPFSHWHFELAWIGSEDTVLAAPILAILAVWAWRVQNRKSNQDASA